MPTGKIVGCGVQLAASPSPNACRIEQERENVEDSLASLIPMGAGVYAYVIKRIARSASERCGQGWLRSGKLAWNRSRQVARAVFG